MQIADIITEISGIAAAFSAVIAIVAMVYSRAAVRAARDQAAAARSANSFARQLGHSEAVIHFTGRYGELVSGGMMIGDPAWAYQLWALYALEYYFFERKWIPDFIFELWAAELASMYQSDEIRSSHTNYMQDFSDHYAPMCDFYRRLQSIAECAGENRQSRNREISHLVNGWPRTDLTQG